MMSSLTLSAPAATRIVLFVIRRRKKQPFMTTRITSAAALHHSQIISPYWEQRAAQWKSDGIPPLPQERVVNDAKQ